MMNIVGWWMQYNATVTIRNLLSEESCLEVDPITICKVPNRTGMHMTEYSSSFESKSGFRHCICLWCYVMLGC